MYQKFIILGNLGSDPEMRYMPNGTAVTNFSVAVNRKWTDGDGEKHEETMWVRVSAFGKRAEVVNEWLEKGRQVLVEGRLKVDPNTGGPTIYQRRDGTAGASFEMTMDAFSFAGTRADSEQASAPADSASESASEDDEIPF